LVLGTGFLGTVTISYVGGTGNDVVLNLVALAGDHNRDGRVDAADYVVWRRTGINGSQGYLDWKANFGATAPGFGAGGDEGINLAQVPEPAAWFTIVTGAIYFGLFARRSAGRRASPRS
jgi:hypothetical protein